MCRRRRKKKRKKKNWHLALELRRERISAQTGVMAPCVASSIGDFERKSMVGGHAPCGALAKSPKKLFKRSSFEANFPVEPLRRWDAATILSDLCFLFKNAATVLAALAALLFISKNSFRTASANDWVF